MAHNPSSHVTLVVPTYNEEHRFPLAYWHDLATLPGAKFLFVNDGSTDGTASILADLKAQFPNTVDVLTLPENCGKGNAVRAGMSHVLDTDMAALGVGFIDADDAFTRHDLERFLDLYAWAHEDEGNFAALWASRRGAVGDDIDRLMLRAVLSKLAMWTLRLGYPQLPKDTQCGLKMFAPTEDLRAVLQRPFESRWLFEVELLQRWRAQSGQSMRVMEYPLQSWTDRPGSKIHGREYARLAGELLTRVIAGLRTRWSSK